MLIVSVADYVSVLQVNEYHPVIHSKPFYLLHPFVSRNSSQ